MQERMRDAAFPGGVSGYGGVIAGYYGGPQAYHVWAPADWNAFRGLRKLPIWVGGDGGHNEAIAAVAALHDLGVPRGAYTALDFETRKDITYVNAFGSYMNRHGYKVWVYGSASTVFGNPALNGYWVADYAGIGPFMYKHSEVRATQYASNANFDSSTVKWWALNFGTWWK